MFVSAIFSIFLVSANNVRTDDGWIFFFANTVQEFKIAKCEGNFLFIGVSFNVFYVLARTMCVCF